MSTKNTILISLFIGLLSLPPASRADDIDIYSGIPAGGANTPNLMFVIDSSANSDASFGTCAYDQSTFGDGLGGAPSNTTKTLGNEQCALVNIVKFLPTRAMTDSATGVTSQVAIIKLGITTSDGMYFPLVPIDDNSYTGPSTTGAGTNIAIPPGLTNRQAFIFAAKNLAKHTGSVDQGDMMQETWAYYTGGDGPTSVSQNPPLSSTATGMISGVTYSGTNATSGCQKNYAVFLGATASSSHVNDSGNAIGVLTDAVRNYENGLVAAGTISQTQANANIATLTAVITNGAQPDKYATTPSSWAREWARFMLAEDINTTSNAPGTQSIITYSISVGGGNVDMQSFIADIGNVGGGKAFTAATYAEILNDILKILNEVQAVNSVFSSSSLPVSVNAQGTFLNQIYMGMFRPDSSGYPRWLGNLKQYQFVYDPTTNGLKLGDSIGNSALSSAGTGFISPNAISFWSCTDLSTTPYADPYLNAYPAYLTSAQISLLQANSQSCSDPTGGFWVNDPSSLTSIAQGYDLADGERVERGGAAQQIRHVNLTDNYTTSPASPRNLYTYCPSGSSCVADLRDTTNAFATTNSGIVASAFGTDLVATISSITRSGTTATVTTSGSHGYSTGDLVTISNVSQSTYDGTFTITVLDSTHFTYPITEYPSQPMSGSSSYTVQKAGTPYTISAMSYSNNTVTVTSSGSFSNGVSVVISGVSPSAYNGTYVISCVGASPCSQFTYALKEQPATAAGTGTVAPISQAVAFGYSDPNCKNAASVNVNAWNNTSPGVSRVAGATTATVNVASVPFSKAGSTFKCPITLSGVVDSGGVPVSGYNTTFSNSNTAYVSATSFTISGLTVSPAQPSFSGATASLTTGQLNITGLSYVDIAGTTTATVTGTTGSSVPTFAVGDIVSIGGTGPTSEAGYLGNFTVTAVNTTTSPYSFSYVINTTPSSPAVASPAAIMTADRSTGFLASDLTKLINWVRGEDNKGDEHGPGSPVTVRPSIHGDVLHSRPTVLNYGSNTITITGTSDAGTTRTATASTTDVATIRSAGAYPIVTFANGQQCPVTAASSTTFTYSTSSCGAAGAQTAQVGSKVVVFYGDNGGVFHAVNGNQVATFNGVGPGDEMWGFIPKEFFIKLNRQRANSAQLLLPTTPPGISPTPLPKDYFVDGATGVYQLIDGNGNTTRAILYLSMRRGGRFIYAIDVTNPTAPTVLWKVDNTSPDMSALGQTWSQPKVANIKGYANPVLIFGGGYDPNEDAEPIQSADTSGRAIYVLDAFSGSVVWAARYSCSGVSAPCVTVSGMNYSIPADITLVDRDFDGKIDRLYAADTGGNIWRVDLQPGGNSSPSAWQVNRLAALGCWTGACSIPASPTQRKFFYAPEVIFATTRYPYDAVVAGSGDREHPLYVSTSTQRYNRLFLLKDTHVGDSAAGVQTISINGSYPLFDATTTPWDGSENGYYISLGSGEKVVNAPLAVAGKVYMSTNTPAPLSGNSCTSNLGIATGYQLDPFVGTFRTVVFNGGGLPPSPVAGVVDIVVGDTVKHVPFVIGGANPDCIGSDCQSALGGQKPPINVSTKRTRTYWYLEGK